MANTAIGAGLSASMGGAALGASIATGAATMGIGLAAVGAYKGIQPFMGKREHMAVNDLRDTWFGSNGVEELGAALAAKGLDGERSRQMIERVFKAKKKGDFANAAGAIDSILGRGIGSGFSMGSNGIRDFGHGQLAMLHGREEVRTEAQKTQEDSRFTALAQELKALRRDFRELPRMLAVATADAVNLR